MSQLTLKGGAFYTCTDSLQNKTLGYIPYDNQSIALWNGEEWLLFSLKLTKLGYLHQLARQRGYISPRLAKRIRKAEGK